MNTQERMKIAEKLRKMLEGSNPSAWDSVRTKYAQLVKKRVRDEMKGELTSMEDWLYDLANQVTQRSITK